MAMEITQKKEAPMGVNVSGRVVEITDEDETLVIAFVPVDAVRRHHHHHDHHGQQASRMSAMATSIMMTTTTMESKR
jgi:hypothetical protein